jgi:hypothetical protein
MGLSYGGARHAASSAGQGHPEGRSLGDAELRFHPVIQDTYSKIAMTRGRIDLHPEVVGWLQELPDDDFGHALSTSTYWLIRAPSWGSPIRDKFAASFGNCAFTSVERTAGSATFIAPGRRIVLLTVFRKTKPRETAQIDRAEAAMKRCVARDTPPSEPCVNTRPGRRSAMRACGAPLPDVLMMTHAWHMKLSPSPRTPRGAGVDSRRSCSSDGNHAICCCPFRGRRN